MKNMIFFMILFLISACTHLPPSVSDNQPGEIRLGMQSEMGNAILPQFQMHDFQLHIHFVSSDRLKAAYSFMKMRGFDGFAGRGMTLIDRKKKSCDVFIQRPHNPLGRGMLTLGHEVSHCIFGQYHRPFPKKSALKNRNELFISTIHSCVKDVLLNKTMSKKCAYISSRLY